MPVQPRVAGARILLAFALACFAAAAIVNPWIAAWRSGDAVIDRIDVLSAFVGWALGLGGVALGLAWRIARGPSLADQLALLFVLVALGILGDRWLLTRSGLPLWQYDAELGYRHRPNAVRTLAGVNRPHDLVRINALGFHDTDFSREKPDGELRILALGDSITMGYGVTYDETFSAALERRLGSIDSTHKSFQVINAGVHGYSTYHERVLLERSFDLAPDLILVGFCLNDVTEPFVVDEAHGGTGLDYHGVTQTPNPLSGWLANETGIGRWLQSRIAHAKSLEAEKRLEVYNVRRMAEESRTDPRMIEAWRIVLGQLDEIDKLAREHDVPLLLVVFPFTFQLPDATLREPQRILAEHAGALGMNILDLTDTFAAAVQDGAQPSEARVDAYFFDEDHLTPLGHELVATRLIAYFAEHRLLERGR